MAAQPIGVPHPVHPHFIDETGNRYGSREVLCYLGTHRRPNGLAGGAMWLVRCDCGATQTVIGRQLRHDRPSACRRCAAGPVPESERVCRWCGRSARAGRSSAKRSQPAYECGACERAAMRCGRCESCNVPLSTRRGRVRAHTCGAPRTLTASANRKRGVSA